MGYFGVFRISRITRITLCIFALAATTGCGLKLSPIGTLSALNYSPTLIGDTAVLNENSNVVLNVLLNDNDLDGDTLSITSVTQGTHGTVVNNGDGTLTYTPNANYHGIDSFTYTVDDGRSGTSTAVVNIKVMNPFTWTGGGSDSNWTTAGNWYGGSAPALANVAVFDGTCSSSCSATIDANLNIAGIELNTGYTGTLTQAIGITLSLGTSGYTQSAGTFVGGDSAITITGSLSLTGGIFTSTTATMIVVTDFTQNGATFIANNGTVQFGNSGVAATDSALSPGNAVFNNIIVRVQAGRFATLTGTMTVNGDFSTDNGGSYGYLAGGTILARGNINIGVRGIEATTLIRLVGNTNQIITELGAGNLGSVEIASTGGTVAFSGTIRIYGNFTYTSGTVNTTGSTVKFGNVGHPSDYDITLNPGSMVFDNVEVQLWSGLTATVVGAMNIAGNLSMDNGASYGYLLGGTLLVGGNITLGGVTPASTTALTLNGNGAQSISIATNVTAGTFTINKSGGVATLLSNMALNAAGQNMDIIAGAIDMNGMSLNVNGTLTNGTGCTITRNGGALTYGTLVNNGTINP